MLSESARVTAAAEAKFRIDAPNSTTRNIKIIALDGASERVVKQLAARAWNQAAFFTASSFATAPDDTRRFSMQGWLKDLAGRTKSLVEEIDTADLVVMVAASGENAEAAAIIAEACAVKHVTTTALVLGHEGKSDAALAQSLAQIRPHAMMLVIASADEYVVDMLTALRA